MSKTYSFPKPDTTNSDRSWEQRWTKKFGQWQKPITVPDSALRPVQKQAIAEALAAEPRGVDGIVDLPPVPSPDLSAWLPADYKELETRALAQVDSQLTGFRVERSPADMLIDWEKSMDAITKAYSIEVKPVSMRAYTQAYLSGSYSGKRETKAPEEKAPEPKKLDREGTTVSSSYLHSVYDPEAFQHTVELIVEMMKPHLDGFDAIAFRGSSGAALAYPLGYLLKKPLIHVRKELGHAYSHVEGLMGAKRIAIVDDFVASGNTLRTLMEKLVAGYAERGYAAPVLSHLFLYAERCTSSEGDVRGAVGEILEGCEIHIAYDS